jgi:hypothetical protein
MKINICPIVTEGFQFAHFWTDTIKVMANHLDHCGHDVIVETNRIRDGAVHLVFGAHILSYEQAREVRNQTDGRLIWVQTEMLGGQSIQTNADHQRNLGLGLGCIDLFQENLGWYVSGAKRAAWTYGPSAALSAIHLAPKKIYDACFIGSITPYRLRILNKLLERGLTLHAPFSMPHHERDRLIKSSHVALSLPYSESHIYTPWPRISLAQSLGVTVAGYSNEDHSKGLPRLVRSTSVNEVESLVATIERAVVDVRDRDNGRWGDNGGCTCAACFEEALIGFDSDSSRKLNDIVTHLASS